MNTTPSSTYRDLPQNILFTTTQYDDINGEPLEELPPSATTTNPVTDDIDGVPMYQENNIDGEPMSSSHLDDIDGEPLDLVNHIDGEPMEEFPRLYSSGHNPATYSTNSSWAHSLTDASIYSSQTFADSKRPSSDILSRTLPLKDILTHNEDLPTTTVEPSSRPIGEVSEENQTYDHIAKRIKLARAASSHQSTISAPSTITCFQLNSHRSLGPLDNLQHIISTEIDTPCMAWYSYKNLR